MYMSGFCLALVADEPSVIIATHAPAVSYTSAVLKLQTIVKGPPSVFSFMLLLSAVIPVMPVAALKFAVAISQEMPVC